MKKSFWTIFSLIILFAMVVLVLPKIVHGALTAPTLTLTGDDKFGDGGNNDPYDSLVILEVHNDNALFNHYNLEYSYDNLSWYGFVPQYKDLTAEGSPYLWHRQYYWSSSSLSNGAVHLRVSYVDNNSATSEYVTDDINIKHETAGRRGSYFVEDFTSSLWNDTNSTTNISWPADVSARLSSGSSGTAYSTNLATSNSGVVLSVAIQPVMAEYQAGQDIKFQISNNGTSWYGSGGLNTYINFTGPTPISQTIDLPAASPTDNKVIWRAIFSRTDNVVLPEIFKLRLQWEVNGAPLPCFTFDPVISSDPNQSYFFDAGCTTDINPGTGLTYAWSWDNGSTTTAYSGNTTQAHIFGTTSPQTVFLYAKDSYGATASTSDIVNIPGVQDSVYGWSWNINYGWTSLNCDNIYYGESIDLCSNSTYKIMMNADRTLNGWAWNDNLGWICYGTTCAPYGVAPDGNSPSAVYNMVDGSITGWARYIVYSNMPEQGWVKLRGEKINGTTWCGVDGKSCTHLNFSINGISGWSWGGAVDAYGNVDGPGWENYLGVINAPWFETKFSSIYGLKRLGSQNQFGAPPGKYSATYCIWSDNKADNGTITNLTSEYACIQPDYSGKAKFPSATNRYSTVDGLLDLETMITTATNAGTVYNTSNAGMIIDTARPLDGKIYYFTGQTDFTIDQALTFFNGRNKDGNASGTIIIDGNLHINNSMRYESSAVQYSSRNLASAAFIVKGDIIIDPSVDTISGVFLALGKEGVQNCSVEADGCGKFITGDDTGSPRKLIVNGMVMARKFLLQRTFKQSSSPAELFSYDGRVSINTPPGLSNVAGGLPTWRETLAGAN